LHSSRNALSVEECLCRIEHLSQSGSKFIQRPWQLSAADEGERIVRISVPPHCSQRWMMSSRSFDAAPFASRAGWMAANIIV
jgi:hypothetical protein